MITIENLSKSFGRANAVDQVSLSVGSGVLCGLLGPNGAGKSTLFKMLIGLLAPDAGGIKIAGRTIQFGDTAYKCGVGYVPEDPSFYEYLTGLEFLQFVAAAKQINTEDSKEEIERWLSFFSLSEKAHHLITEYSQGMRRKISLSAAFLGKPDLLLLDEATNGLDPESSFDVKEYLRGFCESGGTVLFSSHIIETLEFLCDRIIVLNRGSILREMARREWEDLRQGGSSLEQLFIEMVQCQEATRNGS